MMTLYVSPYRRIARRHRHIAKLSDTSEIRDRENVLAVDVKSESDAYTISALVPGIKADDIDVEILNKTVSIRGKFNDQLDQEDSEILVNELPFGRFSRVLTLPTKMDPSEAVANLSEGVFTLRVPKSEEDRPKAIKISVE